MANDRWDDEGGYRPRRYGNDPDYESNYWREREFRGRGSASEDRRARYGSLPVIGLDYGNPGRYPERERYGQERYTAYRDRDEWRGRNYGDEWSRRDYGNDWTRRNTGNEWTGRDYGDDWGRPGHDERGWWDRTKDEVRSWFGDEDAEHRRDADHRGRGPRGYTRSDDRIREDVSDWLMEDRQVDATDIEVMVSGAEVTLTGMVDSREMKWRSENIAADVLGVKDVHNRLRVRSRQSYGMTPSEGAGISSTQASSAATGGTQVSSTPRH